MATICEGGGQATFVAVSKSVEIDNEEATLLSLPSQTLLDGFLKSSTEAPSVRGTPKFILSDDGTHLTLNLDENDGAKLSYIGQTFPKVTHVSGSLGNATDLQNAFDNSNLKTTDLDFSKVVNMNRALYGAKITEVDLELPVCTSFQQVVQACSNLKTARFILPICPNGTSTGFGTGSFYALASIQSIILHIPLVTTFTLVNYRNSPNSFTRLMFERDKTGLSGLASCTTFKLDGNEERNLDAESIENIVDSFTDWSGTGTSATCQFPAGKLTEEQKATLTAKGWTYTEV